MDSVEVVAAAVETSVEVGEDIVTPDLATTIAAETDTETTGDITRIGRGTDTMTTGGEMTGITREAAEVDLAAEVTLMRGGIQMRGDTTPTRPLPLTESVPGGEKANSKYVI